MASESTNHKLADAREAVRTIGLGLDNQVFPRVAEGGLVLPNDDATVHLRTLKESCYVQPERRSSTRSRQRTARRQREARGSWPPSPAAQVVRSSSAAAYQERLTELAAAYPASRVWVEKDGIWLVVNSRLVEGLDREAVFVAAIPFDTTRTTQGWGFWSRGCLAFAQWIGPKHTNFPFGSICAFDTQDNVWSTGDSPVLLLDLFSVWALRHLYMDLFGRWPGSQTARWPHERQLECREDELCGCGSLDKTYAECCLRDDLGRNKVQDATMFLIETGGAHRFPPPEVTHFLRSQTEPPPMEKYI
jgi:hypothetical protein